MHINANNKLRQMLPLNTMISRLLAAPGCDRLLTNDGITSPELRIKGLQGVFGAASVDVRKVVPQVAHTASIAKNLDEYQFLLCSLIRSLPDSDPSKLELQKYRVGIVAAFARMVDNLLAMRQDDLEKWNRYARLLLDETSEVYVKVRSNAKLRVTSHKEAFEFFGVPEDKIDSSLREFYGL